MAGPGPSLIVGAGTAIETELSRAIVRDGGAAYRTDSLRSVQTALKTVDRLDAVFFCRAPRTEGRVDELTVEAWNDTVIEPLTEFAFVAQAARAALRDGSGSIVALLDVDGEATVPGSLAIATLAAGLGGLVRAIAVDLAFEGIRVNGVLAGVQEESVPTPAGRGPGTGSDGWTAVPLRRPVAPADIAEAMLFLASKRAEAITGTILRVDGGILAQRYRPRRVKAAVGR